MNGYKQFRDESLLKEAFDSPAYPFSLDAKSNSMDRFYLFTDDKGAAYRVWFEKRQNLGKKVSRVVIGQNTSGRIFKKVIGRFNDPMRVMGTILAIFRDAIENDTYAKQQDGFTLGLPKNIPPNITRLAGRLVQRAIMGSRFEMAKGVDFSDDEFDYIGVIKRGAREEQVFDGRLADANGQSKAAPAIEQKAQTKPPVDSPELTAVKEELKKKLTSHVRSNIGFLHSLMLSYANKGVVRKVNPLQKSPSEVSRDLLSFEMDGQVLAQVEQVVRLLPNNEEDAAPVFRKEWRGISILGEPSNAIDDNMWTSGAAWMIDHLSSDKASPSNWDKIQVPSLADFEKAVASNSPTQRAKDGFGALIRMNALTKEDFERVMAAGPVTYTDIDFNPAGNSSSNFQASVSFKRGKENIKVGFSGAYGKTIALTTLTVNGVTQGFTPVGGLYRVSSVEQQKKTLVDIFKGADAKALGQIIDAVAPGTPLDVAPTSGVHIRDMLSKNQKTEVAWYLTAEGKADLENIFGGVGEKPTKAKVMAFLKKYAKSFEWTIKGGEVTGKTGDLEVSFKARANTTYKVQNRLRDPRGTKYQIYLDFFRYKLGDRQGSAYHSVTVKTMVGEDKYGEFGEEQEKFLNEMKAVGVAGQSLSRYAFFTQ